MRLSRPLAIAALSTGFATAFSAPAHAADDDATVSVLHGVPGSTVDVYANGEALLEDFEPGTLTDPMPLPAGEYDLKVTAAGDGADGDAVIEADDVAVEGGTNVTIAAHLDEEGEPALTPFANDTSATDAGEGRITVRHIAAAPAVDVRADEEVAFSDLTNPNEDKTDLAAGTVSADVVLAGTDDVAIGPADVELKDGTNTIVYAWGSADDDNLDLAVQEVSTSHSAPGGVPSGTGGQTGTGTYAAAGAVTGGAALAGGLALVLTRRRAAANG